MIAADKLDALVDSLVIPDRKSAAANVDREATLRTLTAILQGGRESIIGLVDRLLDEGTGDDSKVRYALHALAVHVAGLRDDKQRRLFSEALASTLTTRRTRDARLFVLRQLQVAGGPEVVELLGKLVLDEAISEEAAQALLAIKTGAAEQFRKALPHATPKTRLTIIQAVGTLRDRESVKVLKGLADDKEREVRLGVLWALANIGDPSSVETLIRASGAEGFERIKATSACLLLAERLLASGHKTEAAQLYTHLRTTRTDPSEQYIRDAAARGLTAAKP